MKNNLIGLVVGLFLMHSCNESSTLLEGETKEVTSSPIELNHVVYKPTRLFVSDDMLIFYDNVEEDIFKIFDRETKQLVTSFGHIGEGPNESYSFIDYNSMQLDGDTLSFLDYPFYKSYKIDLKKGPILINNDDLGILDMELNRVVKMDENKYFLRSDGMHTVPNFEFILANIEESELSKKEFGKYPHSNERFKSPIQYTDFFIFNGAVQRQKHRYSVFYFYHDLIKIFDTKGDLIVKIHNEKSPESALAEKWVYFTSVYPTINSIYVLYAGQPEDELYNDLSTYKPELRKYSWDGELIASCKLDQPFWQVAIDEKHEQAYGLTGNEDQFLWTFSLKDIAN